MRAFIPISILVVAIAVGCEASPQGRRPPRPGGVGRANERPGKGPGGPPSRGPPAFPEDATANITALATSIGDATLTADLNAAVTANNITTLMDLLTQVAAGNKGGSEADWAQAQVIMEAMLSAGPGRGLSKGNGDRPPRRGAAPKGQVRPLARRMAALKKYVDDSEDDTNEDDDTNSVSNERVQPVRPRSVPAGTPIRKRSVDNSDEQSGLNGVITSRGDDSYNKSDDQLM